MDKTAVQRVEVLLTPEEHAEIKAAAKAEGLKLSPFIRMAAIRLARQ